MQRTKTVNAFLFALLVLILSGAALMRAWGFRPGNDDDVLHGRLAHAFESHYDAVFPVRRLGVSLWAALDYTLFKEGRPGVVLGTDGWLYTDEEFRIADGAQRELERNLALVEWVHKELARRNIALLVAVVPAKARVYPEHLGRRRPPPLHRDLYAHVQAALQADGIASVDLLTPLAAGKSNEPTYLRTDTHWTPYGAGLAADAIADAARAFRVDAHARFRTLAEGEREHRGDLFNFLPLDPYFAFLLPPPDRVEQVRTEAVSDTGAGLFGEAVAAPAALVGTSYSAELQWNFAGALKQALHADVMNYARDGVGPFEPMFGYLEGDDLHASPPRLVIWEVPERYLLVHQNLDAYHLPADVFLAQAGRTEQAGHSNP